MTLLIVSAKRYSTLARALSASFRHRFNAVLADARQRDEYPGGFHVRVSENDHSLHVGDADSDEKR